MFKKRKTIIDRKISEVFLKCKFLYIHFKLIKNEKLSNLLLQILYRILNYKNCSFEVKIIRSLNSFLNPFSRNFNTLLQWDYLFGNNWRIFRFEIECVVCSSFTKHIKLYFVLRLQSRYKQKTRARVHARVCSSSSLPKKGPAI